MKYVAPSAWRFWIDWESPFYLSPGDKVYCYTAIFAPGKMHGVQRTSRLEQKNTQRVVQTDQMPI